MNSYVNAASAAALCTALSIPAAVMAQPPVKPHPAKAPPTAPLATLRATAIVPNPNIMATLPKKPPVVTAVAPKPLVHGTERHIIFVGGKPRSDSDAALNPQPIPPGHVGPGDPVR